jgi:hypothetical protein
MQARISGGAVVRREPPWYRPRESAGDRAWPLDEGAAAGEYSRSMADPVAARIKGAGIVHFLGWYVDRFGQERLRRTAEEMPGPHRVYFDLGDRVLGVLASSWYPAPAIHALLDGFVAAHPQDRETLAREGARSTIDATLKGVYRWLFETMMTPDRYARNAQKLFSRYYEPGLMTKEPLGERGHLSIVRDWPGHHPLLCDMLVHTAEYVYGALGCRDVRSPRTACVAEGAPECRFEITWSGG